MENDTESPCRRRHFWFRRRRFDLKQRSRSEIELSRDRVPDNRFGLFSSTGAGLNHAPPPAGQTERKAFLVGKRAKSKPMPEPAGATRIGYALAYTGAKMGLLHCLPPDAVLSGSMPPAAEQHRRSIAVQTDAALPCPPDLPATAEPLPHNGMLPAAHFQIDPASPLFACLAPFIDPPAEAPGTRNKTFASVGTSSEPESCPRLPRPPPVILTEHRAATPPHCDAGPVASSPYVGLLHPIECLSITRRKSSTGDSAVDLKFGGDEERSLHSGGPPSPFTSSTPSDAEVGARGEHEARVTGHPQGQVRRSSSASWRKLRNVMIWAPFIQQYQRHRYPWIQLAGHQGNFRAGEQGTILKKHCDRECICLKALMNDHLKPFIPEFKGEVERDDDKYVCMQDLLMEFESPSLMDCKLGLRTYLEEELNTAKGNPTPRKDMYEKMIEVDPCEPTEIEHQIGGVTKPRYMQWRETLSSTSTLGFRIEGIKQFTTSNTNSVESNGINSEKTVAKSNNDFKRLKYREDVKACLKDFTDGNVLIIEKYLTRLRAIAASLEKSEFFKNHELIGSSLLFVHDHRCKVSIWMIDFGKTVPLPDGVKIDHRSEWSEGNHEDGYLFGLENITAIFEELLSETAVSSSLNQLAVSALKTEAVTTHSSGPVPPLS